MSKPFGPTHSSSGPAQIFVGDRVYIGRNLHLKNVVFLLVDIRRWSGYVGQRLNAAG